MGKQFKRDGKGQACHGCGFKTIHYRRFKLNPSTSKKKYFYSEYDYCERCGKIYLIEKSKIYNHQINETLGF